MLYLIAVPQESGGKDTKMNKEKNLPNEGTQGEDITIKIIDHLGVLRTSVVGWTREVNLVSWCGRPAKWDIREWAPDHEKGTRGITLTDYELQRICEWYIKWKEENPNGVPAIIGGADNE